MAGIAGTVYNLQDRVVLITGAARGIGAAVARRLVERGANVSLVGLEPRELEKLAGELGRRAIWSEADVTDLAAMEQAATLTAERFGGIDVVIANAGIGATGSVLSIDPAAFDRVIEVNLLGVWRTVRACLSHVIDRRGYVLSIASVAAIVHPPGMASYAAAKAGVDAFSDSLRAEVRHRGVDVGVAYFSWLDTDLVRGADERPAGRLSRSRLKGPAGRTYPVSIAAAAVERGIEQRARAVVAPRWVAALLPLRGVLGRLLEGQAARSFPDVEHVLDEEQQRLGAVAASTPVGAGGAADTQAAARGGGAADTQAAARA